MVKWEILVTALIGAGTIGVGIWQFHVDSRMRAQIARLEARKPFLEQQMKLCFDASEAASTLATTTDVGDWDKAKSRFWLLYWGPLSIVERPLAQSTIGPVEAGMKVFGDQLKPLQANPSLPVSVLERPSINIAHACRDLILDSWEIQLRSANED